MASGTFIGSYKFYKERLTISLNKIKDLKSTLKYKLFHVAVPVLAFGQNENYNFFEKKKKKDLRNIVKFYFIFLPHIVDEIRYFSLIRIH